MSNNPLRNKQALPGGYADSFTMEKNAAAFNTIIANNEKISTSPVPDRPDPYGDYFKPDANAGTPTVTGGSTSLVKSPYEIWMEQYGQQAQLMQAQSYGDWLAAGGMAGAAQKAYNEAVRAAETDYEKSKAMYGANAEALGRAGLTGSGYGDYLTGVGFSGMQGAKVAAADTKALTEAKQRSDYASYLMGVQQTNAQLQAQADAANRQSYAQYLALGGEAKGVVDQKMLAGESDEAIKAYIQQHYGNQFDSQLDGWIAGAHSYNDAIIAENNVAKTDAETEAADAESLARAQAAYSALLKGYQDGVIVNVDTANSELKRAGFTQEEIDKALAEYSESTIQRLRTNMNISGAALADVPTSAYIDDLVTTGQITRPQADAFKSEAQAKRAELLKEKFKSFKDMDEETAAQEFTNWKATIDSLSSADLTDTARAELYGMMADGYISAAIESNEPVSEILREISRLDKNKIGNAAYEGFVDGVVNEITILDKDLMSGTLTISLGIKETGKKPGRVIGDVSKEQIKLLFGYTPEAERSEIYTELGDGALGDIKVYENELYMAAGNGMWTRIRAVAGSSVGGKENAKLMYDILVDYYS